MITNDRQYRITNAQLAKLNDALVSFDFDEVVTLNKSRILAKAQLDALKSEVEILTDQVREYEMLKSGAMKTFEVHNLEQLPNLLIKARISKGLSQRKLADLLGIKEQQIQRYESEEYASASLRRLIKVADSLNLEIYERARIEEESPIEDKLLSYEELEWERFPYVEMNKRNWFEDNQVSRAKAYDEHINLIKSYIIDVYPNSFQVLHRKHVRAGSQVDNYALIAWQCRIIKLAEKEPLSVTYKEEKISKEWLKQLVNVSCEEDGPKRAKEILNEVGIYFVVESHLPKTYLDGAALLRPNGQPIIGLTLRYNRIDNFWFVLFHELAHVVKHLRKGKLEFCFDDLDAEVDNDHIEIEADEFASEALIPSAVWETAIARYVRSSESVTTLAKELGIHSAIIAGRIRREAENYAILAEIVGADEVREHFPEVNFGY